MTVDDLADLVSAIETMAEPDRPVAVDRLRDHPTVVAALANADSIGRPASADAGPDDGRVIIDSEIAIRVARLLAGSGDPSDLPSVAQLAALAHRSGVAGAGVVFAEAADKIALFSGRPQRYGTVMVEHQGDVVQPPVDPSVTDEERVALGVPPMADLQQRMNQVTRQLAVERAAKPGFLPPGERFCRVWNNPDPADLRARMAEVGAGAWADGDVITFVCESDTPVAVTPVFPIGSWPAGDGLQVLSLRVERLDQAVITYTFTPLFGGGPMNVRRGSHDGRFRGPEAPEELPSNDPLAGEVSHHTIESEAMGEQREVTVYRPPGVVPGQSPVIYSTDGNMFAPYARRLDAAIQDGWCPPVVVVAAHAAPMNQTSGNLRAAEYLPGFDDARFANHQRFFLVELAAFAESELDVARDPASRAVFGCSDGAGHALATAVRNPRAFGHVFAYSTGMPPDPSTSWGVDGHPMVHLCAGTLEGGFHQATEAWAGFLELQDAPYHFTERVAGHDLIQWCEELPRAITRAWTSPRG